MTHKMRIYQSPFFLYIKVFLIIFFSNIFFFVALFFLEVTHKDRLIGSLMLVTEEFNLVVMIIELMVISFLFLSWIKNYYWFEGDCFFHKNGVLFLNTEEFIIEEIETIDCSQSIFGRIINSGTIHVSFPHKNHVFKRIQSPENFIAKINDLRNLK